MPYNRILSSKDAESYANDIIETIQVLEDQIRDLEAEIESMKNESKDALFEAEQKGYDEGYNSGCKDKEEECEKKWKPKFVFR